MAKETQIQIPQSLFYELAMYFESTDSDDELFIRCHNRLMEKYNTIEQRRLYNKMNNTNLPAADREKARQEYLANKHINTRVNADVTK